MNSLTKDTFVKHSLGKVVIALVYILTLQAEDFDYKLQVDNHTPYIKEAVVLTVELNQTNPHKVLLFDFDVLPSKSYTFQRLDMQEVDKHPKKGLHAVHIKYTYLLYPLHDGETTINFKLVKKVTTDESVAYSFSGDRDNVKGLITKNTSVQLTPLSLHVKPLPLHTKLVGDFTLTYDLKKHQAKAYEPLPFQVQLKGLGYPPILENLLPKDNNFTLFKETPIVKTIVSTTGSQSTVTYAMAFAHHKTFTLPKLTINAFNPKTEKSYFLTVPAHTLNITKVGNGHLVDNIDSPPRYISKLTSLWESLDTLLGYILVFIAGYFTAMFFRWQKKSIQKEIHPLREKIDACKERKALLQLLMATDAHRFSLPIKMLEDSLYADGKISLKEVKKEVMDML
ncbi:MAG: BatD [uncultured Sulfurovum sp.]|uniref:BatD n=1 Tax=uncultured Sulfurovum sp. TaxID=269237 RepID=A0A6S6S591_9BACT|nr:MAG: BatD [uncultured Sulfurovum sp.]